MINVHYDGENLLPCLQRHTSLMYKYFKSKVNNIDWVGISNIEIIHRIVEKSTRWFLFNEDELEFMVQSNRNVLKNIIVVRTCRSSH